MVNRLGYNPLGRKAREKNPGMHLVRDQLIRFKGNEEAEIKALKDLQKAGVTRGSECTKIGGWPMLVEEGYLTVHGRIGSTTMRDGVLRVLGEELGVKWGGPQPESLLRPREPEQHPKTMPEFCTSFVDMSSKGLKIIDILDDGAWHDYEEISERLEIPLDDVIAILKVLSENQYLVLSERWGKVKRRISKVEALDTIPHRELARQLLAMLKLEKFTSVNLMSRLTEYKSRASAKSYTNLSEEFLG